MGRLTASKGRLTPAAARLTVPKKTAELFYKSPEWRALVRDIKAQRGRWCGRCGSGDRVAGDHIRERKDGGAELDPANIELLCHRCHMRKTAQARALRVGGALAGVGESSGSAKAA